MTREASAGRLPPVAPWLQSRLCPAPGQQLWVSYFRLAMIRALASQSEVGRQTTDQSEATDPCECKSAKCHRF